MTLIDVQPRSATVIVEAPATLYSHQQGPLLADQEDVAGYVMILQYICRELSRRLRRADIRICEVADGADDESTQIRARPVRSP